MTETAAAVRPAPITELDPVLLALRAAITAADALGLDSSDAQSVLGEAEERLRLPTDALVVALVGGTGVGKSSLLNALARSEVSAVGVHRPTTSRPVAWLSRREPQLDALLARLQVGGLETAATAPAAEGDADGDGTRATADATPAAPDATPAGEVTSAGAEGNGARAVVEGNGATEAEAHAATPGAARETAEAIAVLDLPDLDSLDPAHRRRVEELLPRVDAVIWVADPEKYADAVLHEEFLRRWAPRLSSQILALNKSDRLPRQETARVMADASRLLLSTSAPMQVVATSAIRGDDGISELRRWLGDLADEKSAVVRRLVAAATDAVARLGRAGGIEADGSSVPLLPREVRAAAVASTADDLLRLVDLDGMRGLAVAATEREALQTTGPFASFRFAARSVGLGGARAQTPRRYLERWRERGSLIRPAGPAIPALRGAVAALPPAIRPRLAGAAQPVAVAHRLEPVMDTLPAALGPSGSTVPSARGWGTLGVLQAVAAGIAALAVIWLVAGFVVRLPVSIDNTSVIAVAVGGAILGFLLRFVLQQYARFIGRRWGTGLKSIAERSVRERTDGALFEPVDQVEAGRRALAGAVRQALASRR